MTETGGRGTLYAWLANALEDDATIITSSRRLARELRAEHDLQQLKAGHSAWQTPKIIFWRDWLTGLCESASSSDLPTAIDSNASSILWERCIRRHLENPPGSPRYLARQSRQAWQRILEWNVPHTELARLARSHDERAFSQVAQEYRNVLANGKWADTEQLAARAIGLLKSGTVNVVRRITHVGFDRISPFIEAMFNALTAAGCEIIAAPRSAPAEILTKSSFVNSAAEMRAAGAWARQCLLDNPNARVAIVASDLEANASDIARLIREGLAPGWQLGGAPYDQSVNVSFGQRLSEYPSIQVALLSLRWIHSGLTSRDVSVLLRSPFFGSGGLSARSKLELRLRHLPDRKWTAAALGEALASDKNAPEAKNWLEQVQKIAAMQVLAGEKRAPVAWVEHIDTFLVDIGWPGNGSLNSPEFQLVNRWRNLLNELAALDAVLPKMTFSDSVSHLANMARETIYQPETGSGLVSLLGSLEAAGMEFDRLWVTGVDASRWPLFGQPMSLVSRELQRKYAMPDSTPKDSLQYSRRVLGRLIASASTVHLSWARSELDSAQLPSPLLDELPVQVEREYEDPYWFAESLLDSAGVNIVAKDPVPPAVGVERVGGGAYTVQRQNTEPFSAFAYGRLGIKEIRQFQSGLSPSLRGSLLHEGLYQLMFAKPSQQDICEWTESEAASRIETAIDKAFAPALRHADGILRRLFAIEKSRLHAVLAHFLEAEKERLPFAIQHVEERLEFEHAGIQLGLRADRIDRLFDGTLLIIDYKTGSVKNLLNRNGDPVDLQVVVYAAAANEEVGGLALFNIGSRGVQHKGVGGSVEWNNVPDDEWEELLLRWKSLVLTAMEQIAAGDVRINMHFDVAKSRPLNVLSRAEEQKRAD